MDFLISLEQGEFSRARDLCERLIASHVAVYGPNDWRLPAHQQTFESLKCVCALSATDQRLFQHTNEMTGDCVACVNRGEIGAANRLSQQMCRIRQVLLGERSSLYAAVLESHAFLQTFYMETYAEGLESYQQVIAILKTQYEHGGVEVALAVRGLGATYTLLGQYDQAESSLNAAALIIGRHCGERSVEYAICLYYLAQLDLERHDFGRAKERLEESLATFKRRAPSGYPNVAAVQFGLARVHMGEKDFLRAKALLGAILPDYEKLPACYPTRAQMLDAYATTLRNLKQTTEAEKIASKAKEVRSLAVSMRGLVPRQPTALPPTTEPLARDPAAIERREAQLKERYLRLWRSGEFQQSRDVLKSWIEVLAARVGPEHWRVVFRRRDLETLEKICLLDSTDQSLIHLANIRTAEAMLAVENSSGGNERYSRESCRLIQLFLGDDNPLYLNALEMVGWAELNRDDAQSALKTHQQVGSQRKVLYGDQHPSVAISAQCLGDAYLKLKQYDLAESSLRESMTILRRDLGKTSIEFAISLHCLGRVALERGQADRAKESFDQVLEIYKSHLSEADARFLLLQFDCARVLIENHDIGGAEAMLRDAMPRFEKLPDCTLRAMALELYSGTLRELKRPAEAEPLEQRAAQMRARVAALNGSGRKQH